MKVSMFLILGLIVVFVVSSFSIQAYAYDPVQWKVADGGNGHYYQVVLVPGSATPMSAPITWTEANLAAQAMSGGWHLATISSSEENAFVFDLVDNIPELWFDHAGNSIGPWLGASSPTRSSNDFTWVTNEPFAYTNWATLEPYGNGEGLHFFGYLQGTTPASTWNDYVDSHGTKGYIVETVVPEPISSILFITGGAVFAGRRFFCRKR